MERELTEFREKLLKSRKLENGIIIDADFMESLLKVLGLVVVCIDTGEIERGRELLGELGQMIFDFNELVN
jgi:hypothetical protein